MLENFQYAKDAVRTFYKKYSDKPYKVATKQKKLDEIRESREKVVYEAICRPRGRPRKVSI